MCFRIPSRCCAAVLLVIAAGASSLAAQARTAGSAPAESGPPPSAAALITLVDSVVKASLLTQGVPSVSVVVTRGDETLVQRAWGRADVASGRAADASTVYGLGSNSKQFTATLVLRLVDRGRLTLGDSIGRHLTDLRPEWREITIEQLLNHSSGLQRSYLPSDRMEQDLPGDSLLAQAAQDTMFARPGTKYIYSNVGYLVLRVLVEKLYGKPYAAALSDEIARPLGLTSLGACGVVEAGSPATGYTRSADGTRSSPPTVHPSQELGPSGLCSTAADLAKWNRALHGGRVLSGASYRAMVTPRGVSGVYGLGLSVGRVKWGDRLIAHGGRSPTGFTSENAWYPADSLSVTILYNVFPALDIGGTHIIAALALGQTPPTKGSPAPPPAGADTPATDIVGEEALRQFVGEYELGPRAVFKVDSVGGALVASPDRGPTTNALSPPELGDRQGSRPSLPFEMRMRASHLPKQTTRGRSGRPGMATPLALFVALVASAGSALLSGTGPGPLLSANEDATPHSVVRLVSDVASVRPGEPFTVGVHVTLDEGWRTPWKNAGDVGNGFLATWTLPSAFIADSFAYPIPERIPDPPVTSFGYHDEVVFLATITPPADLETGRLVTIRLSADFVVCGHTCIPAHAERSLELQVRGASPTPSGNAALISRYADRLPVAHAQWGTRAARTDDGFVLEVVPPAGWEGSLGGAYFFPGSPVLLNHVAHQPVGRTAAGQYRVRLTESAYLSRNPERIEGILVLPDGAAFDPAGHRGLVVSATVAGPKVAWAAEPTQPVAAPRQASGVSNPQE